MRSCKWVKFQEVVLQESSDQIPTGHIPRVLNVQLRGDITQSCVPGDVVSLSGMSMHDNPTNDTYYDYLLYDDDDG